MNKKEEAIVQHTLLTLVDDWELTVGSGADYTLREFIEEGPSAAWPEFLHAVEHRVNKGQEPVNIDYVMNLVDTYGMDEAANRAYMDDGVKLKHAEVDMFTASHLGLHGWRLIGTLDPIADDKGWYQHVGW